DVRRAQQAVLNAEEKFLDSQQHRRTLQQQQQQALSMERDRLELEMDKYQKGEDKYLQLILREHDLIKSEQSLTQRVQAAEHEERKKFSQLSAARSAPATSRSERTVTGPKYWTLIGSVAGTLLGVGAASLHRWLRLREAKENQKLAEALRGQADQLNNLLASLATAANANSTVARTDSNSTEASLLDRPTLDEAAKQLELERLIDIGMKRTAVLAASAAALGCFAAYLTHSAMDSKPSSKLNCRHCGSSEINEDRRRGDTVCMNCGAVLEEGMIVNEVIGQFMANDSSGFLPGSASLASKLGFQRESRQLTLNNARRRLQQVGGQLRLTQHQIDMAYNFYRTILNRGWTRGRKVNYVIAACLYIVCRTEGTHHMLLDLSDLLQVNVYVLGRSYTEIAKRLCINIPALDPCLYIQRFAQKLEFGDKSREVETTAMRLLQRMKKDWIAVGRRPLAWPHRPCWLPGGCITINRTVEDVARSASRRRASGCRSSPKTPSSTLTIEEFLSVDYEGEHDPPAFLEGLKRATTDRDETDMDRMCQEVGELEALIDREMEKLQERRVRGIVSGLFVVAGTGTAASTSSAAAGQQPSTPAEPAAAEKPDVKPDAAAQFLLNCDDAEVNLSARHVLKDALEGVVDGRRAGMLRRRSSSGCRRWTIVSAATGATAASDFVEFFD
uniref:TFIIB-type domain-containing protein n=1 Tax=Macrostomum lignano TaxID=282301 RepID=A0A1I8F685_9PLAT